jgi:hypothetical protein
MKKTILLVSLVFSSFILLAQTIQTGSFDMVVLRNNQSRTVKSYFSGRTIEFGASNGRVIGGMIRKIERDTLFIQQYDIRQAYSMWGTQVQDTISTYFLRYHYNEILWIRKDKASFELLRNGTLFMVGGSAYTALHLFNAAYQKEPVIWSTVAISTGIAAAGFVMNKLRKRRYTIGEKYELKYINTSTEPAKAK